MKRNANLLLSLYKWASRQDENYTSEAFVHLLNFLVVNEPEIAAVLLQKVTNGFLSFGENGLDISEVEILTQQSTTYGRPDIEIKTIDKLAYIEVKVESNLGHEQLDNYRQALRCSGKKDTFLILLSRYAITSEGEQPDLVIRWYEIADWLESELENMENQSITGYVIEQFLGYLQEKNMTITKVKSGISDGVRAHHTQLGSESIFAKRNRSLSNLTAYPELHSLHNLLMMMGEAVINLNIAPKPRFDSGKQQGGWTGYNINNLQYFFSIYIRNPEELVFETHEYKIDTSKYDQKLGRIEIVDGKTKWFNTFDLTSSEINFLSQPREVQIRLLEKFLKNCYEYSQLLHTDV